MFDIKPKLVNLSVLFNLLLNPIHYLWSGVKTSVLWTMLTFFSYLQLAHLWHIWVLHDTRIKTKQIIERLPNSSVNHHPHPHHCQVVKLPQFLVSFQFYFDLILNISLKYFTFSFTHTTSVWGFSGFIPQYIKMSKTGKNRRGRTHPQTYISEIEQTVWNLLITLVSM